MCIYFFLNGGKLAKHKVSFHCFCPSPPEISDSQKPVVFLQPLGCRGHQTVHILKGYQMCFKIQPTVFPIGQRSS